MVSVLIADDHALVRTGLKTLINLHENLHVAGEAADGEEAVRLAKNLKPDVVIMDIRMPGMNGIEACREILDVLPNTRVIMLTSYADDEAIHASIKAGASGYILKLTGNRQLIEAIERVARGESLLDSHITRKVLSRMKDLSDSREDLKLSKTEERILELIAEGKTNKEIATIVYLAEKTVRNYVTKIFSKLNVTNRTAAAAYVLDRTKDK